ncbi:MAG: carboxypeptidase regulatory-like domain-containing protein [Acidobacteria bacterium]|nr:carboxypeptidase regulatory-like domain-containing protein [Acidobacteriota bacterium]
MFSKRVKFWLCLLAVLSLLSFSVACTSGGDDDVAEDDDTGTTGGATGTPYQSKGDEGTVTGTVAFTGAAPAPQPIDMNADAACASKNPNAVAETAVIKDGKLQNVFVYIKDGTTSDNKKITGFSFPTPADPVKLDQNGCHYVPHVMGIQVNQKFVVTNSDPTSHNVNVQSKSNASWNNVQSPNAPPIEQKFARSEVIIPIKCNQHPWMKSYIGVLNTPFYAISGADGTFTIKGLPPGKYTLVAWHERFGEKTLEINLAAKGSATADFSFDASTSSEVIRSSYMEVLPAIEFPMLMQH